MKISKIAIVGAVGVPANYGGFETLVENLVRYHHDLNKLSSLVVYCSSKSYTVRPKKYLSAELVYIPFHANGAQSVIYDVHSLFSAVWRRSNFILLLGVSGAIALPIIRLLSSAHIVTNIDGIEWRRQKWRGLAKSFLRFSEKVAVRFSHLTIADNAAIAHYVKQTYGMDSRVIAYGGDHAFEADTVEFHGPKLPDLYAFTVCRIEPENNLHVILKAYSEHHSHNLIIVGNWENSKYGRELRQLYQGFPNIFLLNPIYDLGVLKGLRENSSIYLHGHSAGGTNPSLVEAMHFRKPIFAFDCSFNRSTTEGRALYFNDFVELNRLIDTVGTSQLQSLGEAMLEIARRRYTWKAVAEQYFDILREKSASF